MSVAKITELTAESSKSFDDALNEGILRATKTLKNVRSVWVKDHEVQLNGESSRRYRITLKVTFVLND